MREKGSKIETVIEVIRIGKSTNQSCGYGNTSSHIQPGTKSRGRLELRSGGTAIIGEIDRG